MRKKCEVKEEETKSLNKAVSNATEQGELPAESIAQTQGSAQEPQAQKDVAVTLAPAVAGDITLGKKKSRWKMRDILTITAENDIKYRGPLSYRSIRIIAWVLFLLAQIGSILMVTGRLDASIEERYGTLATILRLFSNAMMPLFLIATFATILNGSQKFSSMVLMYGLASLLVIALYMWGYYRYLSGLVMHIAGMTAEETATLFNTALTFLGNGFFAINIFVDLFLCTLFLFFILYKPKKVFTGKRLIFFRLFSLLPILYEVTCATLKLLVIFNYMELPFAIMPFLTTKPPLTFLLFIMVAVSIKRKEKKFRLANRADEEYYTFLQSNSNSFRFSATVATCIVIIVVIDLVLHFALLALLMYGVNPGYWTIEGIEDKLYLCGFGKSISLLIILPFIMLFSYTRTYKDKRADIIIPIVALAVLALICLEGLYQILLHLPDLF